MIVSDMIVSDMISRDSLGMMATWSCPREPF